MIKIHTENVLERGEKKIKILKIGALNYDQLPKRYVKGNCVFLFLGSLKHGDKKEYPTTWELLRSGECYSQTDFYEKIAIIRSCGNRLKAINMILEQENKGWEGTKETLLI